MHRQTNEHDQFSAFTQDDEQDAMTTELFDGLLDEGVAHGLTAFQFTHGVSIDPAVKYDVAAVAVSRFIDAINAMGDFTGTQISAALNRRAVTVGPLDPQEVM